MSSMHICEPALFPLLHIKIIYVDVMIMLINDIASILYPDCIYKMKEAILSNLCLTRTKFRGGNFYSNTTSANYPEYNHL